MTKKDDARRVRKLWDGGEKLNAIRLADEAKLKDEDRPVGMEAHRRGMRRQFQ